MAGYLDHYGAGDARREKIFKTVGISLAAILVIGGILWFVLHNYRQEQQIKKFFDLLAAHDYKTAYALWGCTDTKPCRDYPSETFLRDWGPDSAKARNPANYRITRSRACGSGVILTVQL